MICIMEIYNVRLATSSSAYSIIDKTLKRVTFSYPDGDTSNFKKNP